MHLVIAKDPKTLAININKFLNTLESELQFYKLTPERINSFCLTLVAYEKKEIIGIAGLRKKFGLARSEILIKNGYQGKGLGKILNRRLVEVAKKHHNLILAIIDEKNTFSLRMHKSNGYQTLWKRTNLCYSCYNSGFMGWVLFYILKSSYPAVKVIDFMRR